MNQKPGMALISPVVKQKREAACYFAERLLESAVQDQIVKIVLFGSVSQGAARPSSDVDVLLIAAGDLDCVRGVASDVQLDTYERYKEGVEYLVYPLERLRFPSSYFLDRVLRHGEELYRMNDQSIRRREAENYLQLAEEYLEGAEEAFKAKRWRMATDAAYNAAELCVKGLLLLEREELPTSHGGLVGEFGKLYVKPGKVPKTLGRQLNQSLELRNKARYELHADIDKEKAESILELAKEVVQLLASKL